MIELTVLNYLSEELDVPVYMETPEEIPESYVLIQKTGSGRDNRVDRATFALQSIAPSLYEAAILNESVKAAMDTMDEGIFGADLNSDYEYTNQQTKQYRYQAVYDIYY